MNDYLQYFQTETSNAQFLYHFAFPFFKFWIILWPCCNSFFSVQGFRKETELHFSGIFWCYLWKWRIHNLYYSCHERDWAREHLSLFGTKYNFPDPFALSKAKQQLTFVFVIINISFWQGVCTKWQNKKIVEHSRKLEIYFVICATLLYICIISLVLCFTNQRTYARRICKRSLFTKRLKWNTAINKGCFKWGYNLSQKQPPELFYKKLFFKVSQYSQESTCVGVSF